MRVVSALDKMTLLAAFLALLVVVVVVLLRIFFRRLAKNAPTSVSWRLYLKGLVTKKFGVLQGVRLFMFLLIGAGAAWLSTEFGAAQGKISERIQLVEFDSLNPAETPVYREIDTEKYSGVTVFARTFAPQNGAATIAIYSDQGGANVVKSELRRLTSVSDSWSRWDQPVLSNHLSFVVTPVSRLNTAPAKEVRILVYLVPR